MRMKVDPGSMSILQRIVEQKRIEVAGLPAFDPDPVARHMARTAAFPRDFLGALRVPRLGKVGLIAEVKKASPSAGVIRPDFDPVTVAREYEAAGATCLSVLTDEKFFQGSLGYLKEIRAAVSIPLLRKDFIIDPRQVIESIEAGADAMLLIVAILTDAELARLHGLAVDAGLTVLVEVHDEVELDRALAVGADLIGVNNRDLRSFTVDLGNTERLAERFHSNRRGRARDPVGGGILVAESGIHTRDDVRRLEACGAGAILVGESLMRQRDMAAKIRELLLD